MRAKFINEKFQEESDPIKDMGIGFYYVDIARKLADIKRRATMEEKKFFKTLIGKTIEGYFWTDKDMIHKTRKFKVKEIIKNRYVENLYYYIDDKGKEYRLHDNNQKIKVWE